MDIKKLYNYPFISEIRGLLQSQISSMIEDCPERGIKLKNGYSVSKSEEYLTTIFKRISNLTNTLEQLKFIPIFIKQFESSTVFKENGINQENYIQYHFENHFLKISSILDQAVILISELHNLGIPSKLISLRHLRENKHTKDAPSVKVLIEFDKSIQQIKSKRNKIVHRGEYTDSEMTELFMNNFFEQMDLPKFSQIGINDIIKKKIEILENNNEQILELVNLLFKSVDVEFKYQKIE